MAGLFIPLLIAASYAQWKKVSKGREVNLVMAFTTVFFGLSIIAVSDFCSGTIDRSLDRSRFDTAVDPRCAQDDVGDPVPTARHDRRTVPLTSPQHS